MRWGGSWGEPTKGLGVPWGPGVQPTCVSLSHSLRSGTPL